MLQLIHVLLERVCERGAEQNGEVVRRVTNTSGRLDPRPAHLVQDQCPETKRSSQQHKPISDELLEGGEIDGAKIQTCSSRWGRRTTKNRYRLAHDRTHRNRGANRYRSTDQLTP